MQQQENTNTEVQASTETPQTEVQNVTEQSEGQQEGQQIPSDPQQQDQQETNYTSEAQNQDLQNQHYQVDHDNQEMNEIAQQTEMYGDSQGDSKRPMVHCSINSETITVEPPTFNVFVGDLVPECTEQDLWEKFSTCGEIQTINLMKETRTNTCKGYAFIHFTSEEAQRKALEQEFNGVLIRGRPCRVKLSEHKTALFVGNVPMDLNEDELLDAMRQICGKVSTDIRLELKLGPPPAKKSRGFCFVNFPNHPIAEACKKLLSNSNISGRPLNVSWAETTVNREVDSETMSKVTTLYVSNLATTISEEVLRALFEQFGEVVKCVIVRSPFTQEPRGFAFIQFKDRNPCESAIDALHEREFSGQRLSVVLAKPPPDGGPVRKIRTGATHGPTGSRGGRIGSISSPMMGGGRTGNVRGGRFSARGSSGRTGGRGSGRGSRGGSYIGRGIHQASLAQAWNPATAYNPTPNWGAQPYSLNPSIQMAYAPYQAMSQPFNYGNVGYYPQTNHTQGNFGQY